MIILYHLLMQQEEGVSHFTGWRFTAGPKLITFEIFIDTLVGRFLEKIWIVLESSEIDLILR